MPGASSAIACNHAQQQHLLAQLENAECMQPPVIKLIVSDVDGTLVDSSQQFSPVVEQAVHLAAQAGVPLVVATGKARGPWAQQLLPRLGDELPGVFLQGLLVCDGRGQRLHHLSLPADVLVTCAELAEAHGITLVVYSGARLFAASINEQTDRLKFFSEPTAEAVGDLRSLSSKLELQKMMFLAPPERMEQLRPVIEEALLGRAALTMAIPGMLEVLPAGASKGSGVAWLLQHLGVDPQHVMALGDGENDIEMLQLVGWGVAMGNAPPKLKAVADAVVASNDHDGVAEAIQRFVLQPRGLTLPGAAPGGVCC